MLHALERRARSERRWGSIVPVGRRRRSSACSSLAALLAPVIFPGGPNQQNLLNTLQPPSWSYPFGTDNLGTRHLRALDLRRADRPDRRPDHDLRAARPRRPARPARRLPRRLARDGRHARGRRRRRVPVHRARDRRDRDRRPGAARRLHRDHGRRMGAVRAAHARRGADSQGAAVRARRDEPRLLASSGSSSGTSCRT